LLIRDDYKKSGTALLSSVQGFSNSNKRRTSTKIVIYYTHHPDLKPQKGKPWYRSKVSPGFNHEAVNCYIIVSPKPLKEPACSDGAIRYSSNELYDFLKKGTLLMETIENLPNRLKLV